MMTEGAGRDAEWSTVFGHFAKVLFVIQRCFAAQRRIQALGVVVHRHVFLIIGDCLLPGWLQTFTGPCPADHPVYRLSSRSGVSCKLEVLSPTKTCLKIDSGPSCGVAGRVPVLI